MASTLGFTVHPKHEWQFKNNFLSGITLPSWLRILYHHWRCIHWRVYWQRVLFLTLLSVLNSCIATLEHLLYAKKIEQQQIHPEPIFVIGHPRTGTTHVHNMMACDQQFAFCDTLMAGFPSGYFLLRPLRCVLRHIIDERRPMDNMPLHFELPQEDEIATTVLTGGISAYMPIVFMGEQQRYCTYYTFEDSTPHEVEEWMRAIRWVMKKATLAHGYKPLVMKSPVHTARVKLLLKMFPGARFVYCHRHPLEVFQSSAHMADAYYWYCALQRQTAQQVFDFIVHQYQLLYDTYVADRDLIPKGRLVEVSLQQLEGDAVSVMQRVYNTLGINNFADAKAHMTPYLTSMADFRKNHHNRLTPELIAFLKKEWAPSFATFGYSSCDGD